MLTILEHDAIDLCAFAQQLVMAQHAGAPFAA